MCVLSWQFAYSELERIFGFSKGHLEFRSVGWLPPRSSQPIRFVKADDENFALAISLLEPLVKNNDPEAQYLLGYMFEQGKGFPVDIQKANSLFDLAERQGNVDALTRKGHIYEHGDGVPQDFSKAFEAYEKAANGGGASAQVGVPHSMRLAFVLAQIACRDDAYKDKAMAFSDRVQKHLPMDGAKALEPLVVSFANFDRYSGSIPKDADKFLELLEATESSAKD